MRYLKRIDEKKKKKWNLNKDVQPYPLTAHRRRVNRETVRKTSTALQNQVRAIATRRADTQWIITNNVVRARTVCIMRAGYSGDFHRSLFRTALRVYTTYMRASSACNVHGGDATGAVYAAASRSSAAAEGWPSGGYGGGGVAAAVGVVGWGGGGGRL